MMTMVVDDDSSNVIDDDSNVVDYRSDDVDDVVKPSDAFCRS